ncbi:MAG: formyltransferase family protein, partial [Pirellulales bacterium]
QRHFDFAILGSPITPRVVQPQFDRRAFFNGYQFQVFFQKVQLVTKQYNKKVVLICHRGAAFDELGLACWLSSFTKLVGVLIIEEQGGRRFRQRLKYEYRRVGFFRLLDVLAFKIFYNWAFSFSDKAWLEWAVNKMVLKYPKPAVLPKMLVAHSPNAKQSQDFIAGLAPNVVIARCKTMLKSSVYDIPTQGTFVLHPGICPEYRNSHGCFWALVKNDLDKVGATLLKIDRGVDTGPVYGYFPYRNSSPSDSHVVVQYRVVLDNLLDIQKRLLEIMNGSVSPIETQGRRSSVWGQPWLSKYPLYKKNLTACDS